MVYAEAKSVHMSDREQHGLRGSVKTCVEETTSPGAAASDGTQIPERKAWYKTEYDAKGRIMATHIRNSNGSDWTTQYTYDSSGHLLKTAWGHEGEQATETVYSYDDQERLLKITDSRTPDNPVTFCYDERGRKTKLQFPCRRLRTEHGRRGFPFPVCRHGTEPARWRQRYHGLRRTRPRRRSPCS
jgi:hypothetical protein